MVYDQRIYDQRIHDGGVTSRPWPRARWRSTNGLSTTSCDEAAGMDPVIMSRRSDMGT